MKKQNIQDERLTAQRRKISSEAYGILMIALMAAILVQQFLLNAPFEQYAAESICFLGISIYTIVRYLMLGIDIYGEERQAKRSSLVNSVVTGIVVTIINGVLNYTKYAEQYKEDGIGFLVTVLAITFISASVCSFILMSLLSYLSKKKQAEIQKQLDEDERDE